MNVSYPTFNEPATPEYVLAVFQDWWRLDDCIPRDLALTFETTIAEWGEWSEFVSWKMVGRAFNEYWGLNCKDAEWRAVFKPARERCLFDVCEFIAERSTRPRIREARLLGRPCLPGGAFLTTRSMLAEAGANAEEIGPSTELAPFTRRYARVFADSFIRLSPGTLPPAHFRTHWVQKVLGWGFAIGLILLLLGCSLASVPFVFFALAPAGGAMMGGSLFLGILSCFFCPTCVEFGDLRTFRDLAIALTSKKDPIPEL